MTTSMRVPDATCGHCKQTVETAVAGVTGVTGADLDLESKLLVVEHDASTSPGDLVGAVTEAGYSPELAG